MKKDKFKYAIKLRIYDCPCCFHMGRYKMEKRRIRRKSRKVLKRNDYIMFNDIIQ